ncbi:MAG TPA: PHB depolymerase family esterase [Phycisphaerae bacterium]|nr:PHB depolymerase family esterase [Phycisphaerae bacterium]
MRIPRTIGLLLAAAWLAGQCGCAVPQQPGRGKQIRLVEPKTQMGYWLYLPDEYVANDGRRADGRRWPVVVTLHGLRPYDNAAWQSKEWQEEGDRYGLIIIAPDLNTCDSLTMQLPLRDSQLWYVQKDEKGIIAVMDEVFRRTEADPERVLVTSFSSGGYLAHYVLNRHPERFSCLAVRGSNFSEDLLSLSQLSRYRDTPIGIFFGQNDIKICHEESMRAVQWYRRHRFPVEARMVSGLGHERRPQLAAAMFARSAGLTPKTPPDLGQLVMMEVPTSDGSIARTPVDRRPPIASTPPTAAGPPRPAPMSAADRRDILFEPPRSPANPSAGSSVVASGPPKQVAPSGTVSRTVSPVATPPVHGATPKRPPTRQPYSADPALSLPPRLDRRPQLPEVPTREQATIEPISARVQIQGDSVGRAPMWLALSLDLDPVLRQGSSVLWTNNDVPIGANGFEVQTVLRDPGDYTITAHIVTADDRRLTARAPVRVLAPASRPAGS